MDELRTYLPYLVIVVGIFSAIYQKYKNRHNEDEKNKPFYLKTGLKATIINIILFISVMLGGYVYLDAFLGSGITECFDSRYGCMRVNCIHRNIEHSNWQSNTDICSKLESYLIEKKFGTDQYLEHISKGSCERYIEWMRADKPRPDLQVDYIRNEWKTRLTCDGIRLPENKKYSDFDWAKIMMYEHE